MGAFDDDDQIVGVFVAHAATSLANSQAYWAAQMLGEQLEQAHEFAVIEQAKGILMAGTTTTPTKHSTCSRSGRSTRTGSCATSR